jgi:hypothetical protein
VLSPHHITYIIKNITSDGFLPILWCFSQRERMYYTPESHKLWFFNGPEQRNYWCSLLTSSFRRKQESRAIPRTYWEVICFNVTRSLSENALFPQLFVMLKKLSSEYQLYTCGNFFRIPRFEKKLLFSDSLLSHERKTWISKSYRKKDIDPQKILQILHSAVNEKWWIILEF